MQMRQSIRRWISRRRTRWHGALVLIAFAGCGEEVQPPEPVAQPVKILELGSTGVRGVSEYPARIQASQRIEMAFEVPGRLEALPIREGQRVTKGTLLAKLDARGFLSEAEAARANAAAMRAEFERTKVLFEKAVKSKQEYDRAARNYDVARAKLTTEEKTLDDTVLRAPFDGVIAQRLVNDLENVQAKQTILVLEGEGALEAVVDLPEQDAARVRPGLSLEERQRGSSGRISVVLSSSPDRAFPAELKEIATRADPVTRTFRVTLGFEPPPDTTVLPGMTARIRVENPEGPKSTSSPRVPARAVAADEAGHSFVWVVDPATMVVARRGVQTGSLSGDELEILEGLQAGDWVATSGVAQLREGMQVRRFDP
jgi:RND family efflux transporter MFP subunit